MRTIYNITDRTPPVMRVQKSVKGKPFGRKPKSVLINGQSVLPGKSITVPDDFRLGAVASLLSSEAISVDHLPDWYQAEVSRDVKPYPIPLPPEKVEDETIGEEDEKRPRKKKGKK